MARIKFYRKWKFGGVEYYRLDSWNVWISLGMLELQLNKWPKNTAAND